MQLTSTVTALLALTAGAFAQPIEEREAATNMMVAGTQWTVQNFKRVCNTANTSCAFTYAINKNDGSKATACNYSIASNPAGTPASHTNYNNQKCGAFTISSGWNSQGFTVLSMVTGNQIIYPGYSDAQLAGNKVVKPDQSYTPAKIN